MSNELTMGTTPAPRATEQDKLMEALFYIHEEAQGRVDIVDGQDGPQPNIWMRICQRIEELNLPPAPSTSEPKEKS